jgi:hypothetical protein
MRPSVWMVSPVRFDSRAEPQTLNAWSDGRGEIALGRGSRLLRRMADGGAVNRLIDQPDTPTP